METQIFQFLEKVGPWGVVGAFLFFIIRPLIPEVKDWIRSKIPGKTIRSEHEEQLTTISEGLVQVKNHQFHEIIDVLKEIRSSNERIEQGIVKANDNLIYVKSRINGKNN